MTEASTGAIRSLYSATILEPCLLGTIVFIQQMPPLRVYQNTSAELAVNPHGGTMRSNHTSWFGSDLLYKRLLTFQKRPRWQI